MQVYFTVNVGRKFWDSSRCPLIEGVPLMWGPLNTGFTVAILKLMRKQPCGTGYSSNKHCTCAVKKILRRLRFQVISGTHLALFLLCILPHIRFLIERFQYSKIFTRLRDLGE